MFGPVLQCFVYGELLRLASWADDSYDLMMDRDKDQLEVDVVIANGLRQLVGVGIKASASVQAAHLPGLRRLAAPAGDRFLGGVVLYDGIQSLPLASLWHGAPAASP